MKVALIGRPNVGKSSVFNRLVGKRIAIVDDTIGVTRDRKIESSQAFGLNFSVIDTPGVVPNPKNELSKSMNEQSFAAINESDLIFLVIDIKEGVTQYDKEISTWIRSVYKKIGNKPTVVVANKSENTKNIASVNQLGFGEAVYVSAEHNLNIQELFELIIKFAKQINSEVKKSDETDDAKEIEKIAIVGRPNVGKSTLLNTILGDNRVVTGDFAGTTRDSIGINFEHKGKKLRLIDTAGQRRQAKVSSKLENVSILDAWRYIKQVHAVIIVVDANAPFESQDLNIARKVVDEGKIVVFAVNKIDTISNPEKLLESLQERLKKEFAQVPRIKCIGISAKNNINVSSLLDVIQKLYSVWTSRVKTNELNKFLEVAINAYHPPLVNGMPIKIKYISQTSAKPPAFTLFASRAEHLPESYKRYLLNKLRETFKMYSVPIRLNIRSNKNPYNKK